MLRTGLELSSVYLEARLLLIQLLFESSRKEECAAELSAVTASLEAYPAFWEVWAENVAPHNRDLALAIRLMASTIRHPERSLSLILESGLGILEDVRRTFSGTQPPPPPVSADGETYSSSVEEDAPSFPIPISSLAAPCGKGPETTVLAALARPEAEETFPPCADEEPTEETSEEAEPTLRTRSMADVLAEQGDVAGALEIYQELEAAAPTPEEARELHDSVVTLASRIARNGGEGAENPGEDGTGPFFVDRGEPRHLMALLESLADCLEARARA
ncbi:MAG: tetratricopeptide repeat protein [Bilophila sp.]